MQISLVCFLRKQILEIAERLIWFADYENLIDS